MSDSLRKNWLPRSATSTFSVSWSVTDLTPLRITFLAISMPSPLRPLIRTEAFCILSIASLPVRGGIHNNGEISHSRTKSN